MRYRPLWACVVFLGLPACLTEKMSNIDPTTVRGEYNVRYDDSDHSLIGEVQFTTQKTADGSAVAEPVYIELDNGSTLAFDDKPMIEVRNFLDQITYRTILTGLPPSQVWEQHRFRYQKSAGEAEVTAISPVAVPKAVMPAGKVSQSAGFTVAWQITDETAASDSLSLQWNTVDQYPGYLLKSGAPVDGGTSGQIAVASSDLLSWSVGQTYYLQLCRQRQFYDRSAAGGLSKMMESCSPRRPVMLVQ